MADGLLKQVTYLADVSGKELEKCVPVQREEGVCLSKGLLFL